MPQIFSRHHHKFLSNFIEFGKIKILSEKKRLIFAKNKNKFIFPVYVRMKTEHLLHNEFGVTALIKKIDTTS
jgi:ribosomal protein L39E